MKTNPSLCEGVLIVLLAVPFLFLLVVWNQLPATFPTHFSISGQADRFGDRTELIIIMGFTTAVVYGLMRIVPLIDPKKRLTAANYGRMRWSFGILWSGFLLVMFWSVWRGVSSDVMPTLATSFVFLVFAAFGNAMLTIPHNYFVGIRTPWTLNNPENWRKTHRLSGRLWVAGGLAGFGIGLFLPEPYKVEWVLSITAIITLVPLGYSYWLYRQRMAVLVAFLFMAGAAQAQTEEPISYAITAPAGVSLTLDGTLTVPANTKSPVPVLLLIAGSGPTDRDSNSGYALKPNTFKLLADSLVRRGVAVARYDKRGSGTNLKAAITALKPQEHQFDYYVGDAVGFIRQLQADKRFSKVIVAGHSEGALVGVLAARQTNANGYVSIAGAGRNIADILKEQNRRVNLGDFPLEQARRVELAELQAEVDAALDSMRAGHIIHPKNPLLKQQLPPQVQPGFITWMRYDPAVEIKAFRGPVLIIQGRNDFQVTVKDAELLKAARPDAQLILFDTMNHVLKTYVGSDMAENFKTYSDTTLPLAPGLVSAIAQFVRQ